ncbi:hypothetical protein [Streptococcus suis]|nr:hypothetical protein [Streptococcus suis]
MWDRQIDSLEVSYATLVTAFEDGREEGREEVQITSALHITRNHFRLRC